MAFDLVSTATVTTTGVTQIDFSSIPQTGKDLFIMVSARTSTLGDFGNLSLYINGENTNQSSKFFIQNGQNTPVGLDSTTTINRIMTNGAGSSANCFSGTNITIYDYSSTQNKNLLIEAITPSGSSTADVGLAFGNGIWAGGAAINSLSFRSPSNAYVVGTSISLYIIS